MKLSDKDLLAAAVVKRWPHQAVFSAERLIRLNGRWGFCKLCPRDEHAKALPELCQYTEREDHNIDWTRNGAFYFDHHMVTRQFLEDYISGTLPLSPPLRLYKVTFSGEGYAIGRNPEAAMEALYEGVQQDGLSIAGVRATAELVAPHAKLPATWVNALPYRPWMAPDRLCSEWLRDIEDADEDDQC